jgi:hypothetical protein
MRLANANDSTIERGAELHRASKPSHPETTASPLRQLVFLVLGVGLLVIGFNDRDQLTRYASDLKQYVSARLGNVGAAAPMHQATVTYEQEVNDIATSK